MFAKKVSRLASAVLLAGAVTQSVVAATPPAKPNIIIILADDLGYGDVSAYGQQRFTTPNIDALARCGTRFTDGYAAAAICAPSRAALLSGKDTGHGQIRGNISLGDFTDEGERGEMPLSADTQTIASVLKPAGYATGAFGKWGLGGLQSVGVPWRHGFDSFYGYLDQYQAHNYFPTHLWMNDKRVPLANKFFIPHWMIGHTSSDAKDFRQYIGGDYAPYRIIAQAENFIAANKQRPFFLYYAPTIPHAAVQVPEAALKPFAGRWPETPYNQGLYTPHPTPRAARAAMITELDAEVGRIVKLVHSAGIQKKTLILFTSDNGPEAAGGQDIDFFNSAGGLRGGKGEVYEGGIRMPLIACWPGQVPAGRTSATPIGSIDFMPTFAALAGVTAPPGMNGISVIPALLGTGPLPDRSLYWESHEPGRKGQAVRIGPWKGVRLQPRGFDPAQPVALYDLSTDRAETRDLAGSHPDIVARMVAIMNARIPATQKLFNF